MKLAEDIFLEGLLNNETKDELHKIIKKNKKLTISFTKQALQKMIECLILNNLK